jgi:hypothetical protein
MACFWARSSIERIVATTPISVSSLSGRLEPGLMTRVIARVRGREIDDQLLAGNPPDGNPVALARLARLLDVRYRSKLADALRRLLAAAKRGRLNPFVAELPLQVPEVLGAEPLILKLAAELEHEESVSPRGVILADRLIRDGDSPVYWRSDFSTIEEPPEQSVELAVRHARAALHLG